MIPRRRFLELSAGAAAALVLTPGAGPRTGWLDVAAAANVGRRYLRAHPEDREFGDVAALLARSMGGDALAGIRRAVARDFRTQRVVVVDGWVLSRTEARLCAHLALERGAT